MNRVKQLGWIVGIGVCGITLPAIALPGQTTDEAAAWMRSNATIRPGQNETFLVRRLNTAAQQLTFNASLLPPGKLTRLKLGDRIIRSETLSLFDRRNGVTLARLRESVRAIYGIDIAQDFDQAAIVKTYPTEAKVQTAVQSQNAQTAALQGELRKGDRFAYWLEIAQTPEGYAYSGQLTVFLPSDLDKLQAELTDR